MEPDADLPPGGEVVRAEDLVWDAWTPWEVAERLGGHPVTWAVAGGWAVDLHLGRTTREHEDTEIVVPRGGFPSVRAALGHEVVWDVVGAGRRWPLEDPAYDVMHQTWGRTDDGVYRLDVFRDLGDTTTWRCRRDPSITRPYAEAVVLGQDGIPVLAPEIVLLYKAKWVRDKDESDLEHLLPVLGDGPRAWLRQSLEALHPGHAWAARV